MQVPDSTNARAAALIAIKVAHTFIWALLAGCVLAIPVASWHGEHRLTAWLSVIVAGEVLVLLLNRGRCPLTAIAARFTDDRREDFDIYLPVWLARHNKLIFGVLYVAGLAFALTRWTYAG